MIRVVAHVMGGSDARVTEIAIELGERDAPDAVPHLVAALRAEVARRRVGAPVVAEVETVEVTLAAVHPPEADAPKPDA